jgi:DDE family transposase
VVSVDTKKKELVGPFRNGGREWQAGGCPEEVRVHDFPDPELGKAIPYGVYDLAANEGWVSVGTDHDTAEFAVESLRRWWQQMGKERYPNATRLLITADSGGSNASQGRLWKQALQQWADEVGLTVTVCHFPPGTSKWNKIEHRMFAEITKNWRGRPLVSHAVIIDLIVSTRTQTGLQIRAALDEGRYPTGKKVSDRAMASLALERASFHGDWNYTLHPRPTPP